MTTRRILAIDQGTTSTRAVMFDDKAHVLATAQVPLKQIYPRDGWVEHDPEEIWQATLKVCRDVIAATGGIAGVVAIGITAVVLAILATLYPSWRASRINPVECLRHE